MNMTAKEHHICQSPSADTSLGSISQVPADYMPLVCLGVKRKLLYIWLKGSLKTRLGQMIIAQLSNKLLNLKVCFPSEFNRKPRSYSEFER